MMSAPTYTPSQIDAYLDHIRFPSSEYPRPTPQTARTESGLAYLSALQRCNLPAVPFENLSLHYSHEKILSLDSEDLYQKIVGRRRGGYCMENNQFFSTVLRSLGFEVVVSGARVHRPDGSPGGWSHQITLVVIDGSIYLVDVGFGGNGPTRPIPLVHEHVSPWGSTQASNRVILLPPSNPIVQGMWLLQHRISPNDNWVPLYSFGLTQFIPPDFEVMNHSTSSRKDSMFTHKVVIVKMLPDDSGGDIGGIISLDGPNFRKRFAGETKELKTCETEGERVDILKELFGVTFSARELRGIKGTVSELKGGS